MNNRLIKSNDAGGGACTNTLDLYNPFPDGGGVALYQLNGDATDVSGNYNGTASNVTYGTGQFGQAGVFTNTGANDNDSIDTNTKSFFGQKQTCSVSAWFKNNSTFASTYGTIFTDYANTSFNILIWMNSDGTIQLYNRYNNGNTTITSSGTYNDNQWHNVVGVINTSNNTMQLYIDNVEIGNVSISTNAYSSSYTGTIKATIGNLYAVHQSSYNSGFIGSIDQVRIFSRALRPYEVEALYTEEYCTPTIVPSEHFNTALYTGNGSTQSITGVGFAPDLVWIKPRSFADNHVLSDSVRGVNKSLASNTTSSENSLGITSFDSNGFSLPQWGNVTSNGNDFVAWNFKAGGSAVTNTDGTITSQVSANTEAGFSVVSYTGNGVSGATVGHGLGVEPSMLIIKNRDSSLNWIAYHIASDPSNPETKYFWFNLTNAVGDSTTPWNDTRPTSENFTLGNSTTLNENNSRHIAYCFAEVEGFSNFGSYVGNGSTSGPTVVTGFEPAFVMIKNASIGGYWHIIDNKRSNNSGTTSYLFPNEAQAEATNTGDNIVDFLSNGFQVKASAATGINGSGNTLIYMAFAADPTTIEPSLEDSFNTVTYTGNGSTRSVTGVGFQPQLSWIKVRNTVNQHFLVDDVRGNFYLRTNDTTAETAVSGFSGFTSDGFDFSLGGALYNGSGLNYVAWNWKGAELPAINSNGSIPSVVSANPAAGFSIVSYTGTGSSNTIVGTGLDTECDFVIIKNRNNTNGSSWIVQRNKTDKTKYLYLNDTRAESTSTAFQVNINTNNGTFEIDGTDRGVNTLNDNFIAYCFHSVAGFSKFGSYTGNASVSGPTVTTGFEPAFVMVKQSDFTNSWLIYDNKRNPTNSRDKRIFANSSAGEFTDANQAIDFNSTGFQIIGTDSGHNRLNGNFIYMAFANQF